MSEPLLEVRDLAVAIPTRRETVHPVQGVSLTLDAGRTLGLVGESGSGKTISSLAPLGLVGGSPQVSGSVRFAGTELVGAERETLRALRGRVIGVVFQDPLSSLHPAHTIGAQVAEALCAHEPVDRRAAHAGAAELLERVHLTGGRGRLSAYPHELSGGERQRVMIAMAIANRPRLLIADEPTTALDSRVRVQIVALLRELRDELGLALLLISHDIGLMAKLADEIAVMDAGRIVEHRPTEELLARPEHLSTARLLEARLTLEGPVRAATLSPGPEVLTAKGLVKRFPHRPAPAVDGVDLVLRRGETLALVGESGCGKTTTARMLLTLTKPYAGSIAVDDRPLEQIDRAALASLVQIVFQDPFASLNPRRTVGDSISDPIRNLGRAERRQRVAALLTRVGLDPAMASRLPASFSGGERQRIAIARALAAEPAVLIADEPLSSLDAPVQARILDLLAELQRELGLTLLLITHDLAVVRAIADRVAVMAEGRIVETGDTASVFSAPAHSFTRALIEAAR